MKRLNILDLAIDFSLATNRIKIRGPLKAELDRAASSVTMALTESHLKGSRHDNRHIFDRALADVRECQNIFRQIELKDEKLLAQTDFLASRLCDLLNPPAKVSVV